MFQQVYDEIAPYTLVSPDRCLALWGLSRRAAVRPGDMAEVGVYRGGTSILLKRANPQKVLYSFDTFLGIPNANPREDRHASGDFGDVSKADVERLYKAGIQVTQGIFPYTADPAAAFCFAHFDGDTYQSCTDFLEYFWPRLAVGGILVFDDYRWPKCPGVQKALDEFGKPIYAEAAYQAYLIKEEE